MGVRVANNAHDREYRKSHKAELPWRVDRVHTHMDGVLWHKLAFKQ
jgi:hypothetical protein